MENNLQKPVVVSIIIATYNAEKYISECLSSIFTLPQMPIEVVVVDGGSTDRTMELISSFQSKQLKVSSGPDKGIYDAMNKGIALAQGQWLYFMGADDRLLTGFGELIAKLADQDTIYYGNSQPIFEDIPVDPYGLLQGEFSPYRLAKYCMNHQSILYPAKAFINHKYELEYKVAADYAANLRLWGDESFKKVFYPIEVVSYNMGGFSAGNRDILFYKHKSRLVRQRLGWKVYLRYVFRAIKDQIKGRDGV